MPLADFIHLRVHTAYSLSAGAIKIKELVGLCKSNKMPAVAITDSDLPKALSELSGSPHLSEVVIVSTCMRTEVYAVVERFHDGLADIEGFFRSRSSAAAMIS